MTRRHGSVVLLAAVLACADPSREAQLPTEPFTVPRGATLHAVAESLHAGGFIESPGLFRFYATISGRGRAVQAGACGWPTT